ncbi:CBS domain-containing protein [Novosphingobium fluoreni]|uniref:CBS domain-containing protein n=1 Tax=Novosphingobium fluoreni TaxID=1391222 RepID=UPI003D9FEA4B
MSTDVQVAAPDNTMQSAARAMADIDAGFLPVAQDDRLIGIVTDRDIAIRGVAAGRPPETSIREVMSEEVRYCFAVEDSDTVLDNMSDIQVRRLPVVDREKKLVGIVSITDLASDGDGRRAGKALGDIARPSAQHSQAV